VYEKQIATSASAFDATSQDPGSFTLMVSMKPGQDWHRAHQIAESELRQIISKKVNARDLQKVKNQVMKEFVDGLETTDEKAQSLAINEIFFGDYRKMFSDLEKYDQVTVADLQRVAKKYIQPQRQVTVLLKPKKGGVK
jgi:predicted Zn-dependent peptidase